MNIIFLHFEFKNLYTIWKLSCFIFSLRIFKAYEIILTVGTDLPPVEDPTEGPAHVPDVGPRRQEVRRHALSLLPVLQSHPALPVQLQEESGALFLTGKLTLNQWWPNKCSIHYLQKWWLFASEWWPTGSSDGQGDHHEPLWAEHWISSRRYCTLGINMRILFNLLCCFLIQKNAEHFRKCLCFSCTWLAECHGLSSTPHVVWAVWSCATVAGLPNAYMHVSILEFHKRHALPWLPVFWWAKKHIIPSQHTYVVCVYRKFPHITHGMIGN